MEFGNYFDGYYTNDEHKTMQFAVEILKKLSNLGASMVFRTLSVGHSNLNYIMVARTNIGSATEQCIRDGLLIQGSETHNMLLADMNRLEKLIANLEQLA
jgi:hypothetical protein